ncbi:hypothetical protein K501DRAFT_334259 [Backusella circina FSU 941]|nr:hypothetical protein K501DRAFT_334259 [Backusella circina FSU 941]
MQLFVIHLTKTCILYSVPMKVVDNFEGWIDLNSTVFCPRDIPDARPTILSAVQFSFIDSRSWRRYNQKNKIIILVPLSNNFADSFSRNHSIASDLNLELKSDPLYRLLNYHRSYLRHKTHPNMLARSRLVNKVPMFNENKSEKKLPEPKEDPLVKVEKKELKKSCTDSNADYSLATRMVYINRMLEQPRRQRNTKLIGKSLGIHEKTAQQWWEQYEETGEVPVKKSTRNRGRPCVFTNEHKNHVQKLIDEEPQVTVTEVVDDLIVVSDKIVDPREVVLKELLVVLLQKIVFLKYPFYLLGGITFLPLVGIIVLLYTKGSLTPILPKRKKQPEAYPDYNDNKDIIKKGWIRTSNQYQPKIPESKGLMSGIQSYVGSNSDEDNNKPKGLLFGVLKHGTLYLYESEKQQKEVMSLVLHDFEISLYPKDRTDYEMYARSSVIRLVPNALVKETIEHDGSDQKKMSADTVCTLSDEDITFYPTRVLYITCSRKTDKEDWYFGLLQVKHQAPMEDGVMMDSTHFEPSAMDNLIRQVQSSQSQRDMAWLNAMIGRIFLATYKTEKFQEYIETKVKKKVAKTKRPNFLDEIHVRKVDMSNTVPFITDPKLLSLTPQGDVMMEAQMDYGGGLTIEIETYFNWQYTSLMKKPIRMHVILAVKLKKLSGKLMFKLKPPPTNRCWIAFFEMPDMEWEIKPVVSEKHIKLAVVTNAIESRIKEVMMETFVLPNMEDTPFFASAGKGGIFGEYIKQQKKETTTRSNSSSSIKSNHSKNSSTSSLQSAIRNTPSVPNLSSNGKQHTNAVDALKLETRRAESVSGLELNDHHPQQKTDEKPSILPIDSEIVSQSTPDLRRGRSNSKHSGGSDSDNEKTESRSLSESIQHRWSNTILRKRHNSNSKKEELEEKQSSLGGEDESDGDSTQRSSSSIRNSLTSRFGSKASSIASLERNRSTAENSANDNSKKHALFQMAGNLLNKKSTEPDLTPLDDEKREKYAERLAQMRQRVVQKHHNDPSQEEGKEEEEKHNREHISEESPSTSPPPPLSLPPPPPPPLSSLPPKKPERGIAHSEHDGNLAPVPPSLPPRHHQQQHPEHNDDADKVVPPPIPDRPAIPDRPKSTQAASPPPLPTAPRPTTSKVIPNEQNEQGPV